MNARLVLFMVLALLASIAFASYMDLEADNVSLIEQEADMEMFADAEMDAEMEAELEADAEAEAENVVLPVRTNVNAAAITGVVQLPIAALNAVNAPKTAADLIKVVAGPTKRSESGWALTETNALQPTNTTDLFAVAYERIKNKWWHPFNISQNYNIRDYSYVVIPGFGAKQADYLKPVMTALASFGVHPVQIKVAPVDYTKSTMDNAAAVFKTLNETYTSLKSQEIIVITHSNGIIPFHAAYALYSQTANFIHGLIPLNPTWGGSLLASSGLAADVTSAATATGVSGVTVGDMAHKARKEFIAKFPLDYNALRVMSVATHNEKPSAIFSKTTGYIKSVTGELNDGVSTLSDQLIPASRAIILYNVDNFGLVLPTTTSPIDQVIALQSIFYTFFKTTP